MEEAVVTKCCPSLLHSIPQRRRNYCSLLEWQDSASASQRGPVGAPGCLEEGCGRAAQALPQGAPQAPRLGPLLLSGGAGRWIGHQRASLEPSVPVCSLLPTCQLPAAGPRLPLLLPPGWTQLVASNQDLRGCSQRTSRSGAEAHSPAFAPGES